ncbi:hypothetical protein [Haloferula sp. BvORR071]|uniref:hypothetical protein n=1 Tax=Haloferula sp. BvORR071 TaxID=1396141 RepID=UPI002240F7E7|nr:hypothetical protein [Haloferula sp. BvORR071]
MLLLLSAFCAALAPVASAQSVWGGTMSWTQTGPKTVNVEVTRTIRRGLYPAVNVGDTINTGSLLNFGDAGLTAVNLVVTSIDAARDKMVTSGVFPHTYTFSGSGSFTAFTSTCCRPAPLPANGSSGIDMRLSAQVILAENVPVRSSPRVYLPAQVLYAPTGAPLSFAIPASDPDGDSFGYRFATTPESSLTTPIPTGATLDASTGVFTLPAQAAAIRQCVQVILDDGEGTSSVDMVFSFLGYATAPPAFTSLPAGRNVIGYIGQNTDFQIAAVDPELTPSDATDIVFGALPPGLSLLSSVPSGANSNTRTLNMRWSPQPGQTTGASAMTFMAINPTGEAALTTLTFTVVTPYAAWAATAFPAESLANQREPGDDPDGDGTVNGLEFVTGGNPLVAAPLFTSERNATELILSYPRRRSVPVGADRPQVSVDLTGWLPATGLQREVLPLDDTRDQIRLHLPLGPQAQQFLRVVFDEGAF